MGGDRLRIESFIEVHVATKKRVSNIDVINFYSSIDKDLKH